MTDEHGMGTAPEPTPPAEMPEARDRSVLEGAGDFTTGQGLVALAGMVLLGIWLIFDVILDEFGITSLEFVLAALVVMAPRLQRDTVEAVRPLPVVMKVAGYAIALLGVYYIIGAIEDGFYDDALTIVGALASYVAYVMAFLGARQIQT